MLKNLYDTISSKRSATYAALLLGFLMVPSGCQRPHVAMDLAGTVFDPDRPVEYRLFPGDKLRVIYPTDATLDQNVSIRSDGMISLPYAGEVRAAGRKPEELQAELNKLSSEVLKEPNITVMVVEEAGRKFFIGGEVGRPGAYSLRPNQTLIQALHEAGGLRVTSEATQVLVLRYHDGFKPEVLTASVEHILAGVEADVRLDPYDVIHAPPSRIAKMGQWMDLHINAMIPRPISFPFSTYLNAQSVNVSENSSTATFIR